MNSKRQYTHEYISNMSSYKPRCISLLFQRGGQGPINVSELASSYLCKTGVETLIPPTVLPHGASGGRVTAKGVVGPILLVEDEEDEVRSYP